MDALNACMLEKSFGSETGPQEEAFIMHTVRIAGSLTSYTLHR